MNTLGRLMVILALAIIAGCDNDSSNATGNTAQETIVGQGILDQADLIVYLDGSKYLSESEGDLGNGENGPIVGRLIIEFSAGIFDWSYSGLVEQGNYEFIDTNSMLVTLGNTSFEVLISPMENIIIWMEEVYTRTP